MQVPEVPILNKNFLLGLATKNKNVRVNSKEAR